MAYQAFAPQMGKGRGRGKGQHGYRAQHGKGGFGGRSQWQEEECSYGQRCIRFECQRSHPSSRTRPCYYVSTLAGCTNPMCTFLHPKGYHMERSRAGRGPPSHGARGRGKGKGKPSCNHRLRQESGKGGWPVYQQRQKENDMASSSRRVSSSSVAEAVSLFERLSHSETARLTEVAESETAASTPESSSESPEVVSNTTVEAAPESRTSESADAGTSCVVCLSEAPTHAFVPCGHRCVCGDCEGLFASGGRRAACPLCRKEVRACIKIFLS